jgi:Uncharacterized conserved protein (DUF2190)
MPGPNYGLDKGFISDSAIGTAGNLNHDYFRFVKLVPGTAERVTQATVAEEQVIGVAQNSVATADIGKQVVDVRVDGISKVVAAAAVAIGARVTTDTSGRATSTGLAAGDLVAGIALSSAAAAGDLIDVLLTPGATF